MLLRPFGLTLALPAFLQACETPPPPPAPQTAESSIVAIKVSLRAPIEIFSGNAERVYFARPAAPEGACGSPIPSDHASGDHVYLLNAHYVAIAAEYADQKSTGVAESFDAGGGVSVGVGARSSWGFPPAIAEGASRCRLGRRPAEPSRWRLATLRCRPALEGGACRAG